FLGPKTAVLTSLRNDSHGMGGLGRPCGFLSRARYLFHSASALTCAWVEQASTIASTAWWRSFRRSLSGNPHAPRRWAVSAPLRVWTRLPSPRDRFCSI